MPPRNAHRMTDRELLLLVADDVADIKKQINGNGQPGLVTRVARLEGGSTRTTAKSGGLSALVAIAVAVVMQRLGIGS